MTPTAARFGLFTFAVLTGALAANIFVLQPPGRRLANLEGADRASSGDASGWHRQANVPEAAVRDAIVPPLETGAVKPIPAADRSDLTRAIQRELKARGYETGAIDGVPGLVTRGAIMAYEADVGLPLTGEPRQELLQHIVLGSGQMSGSQAGDAGAQSQEAEAVIRAVQTAFRELGYMTGLADGRLNDETRRAIRKFEVERRLKETGRISGELLSKLGSLAGEALRTGQR